MNVREAVTVLTQPSVRLAFDTNAVFGTRALAKVCREAHALAAQRGNTIELFVSSAVYGEKVFQLKQANEATYDLAKVVASLQDLRLIVQDFTEADANVLADLLGAQFPRREDWQAHKRQHYLRSLGLPADHAVSQRRHLSATVDWLIAAHAKARGCVLVTSDTGPEFAQVQHVKLAVLQQALAQLLPAAAPPPISQGAS